MLTPNYINIIQAKFCSSRQFIAKRPLRVFRYLTYIYSVELKMAPNTVSLETLLKKKGGPWTTLLCQFH